MKIVLDTNILLVSIGSKSKYRPIFDKLINGEFDLSIGYEILLEYEEIITRKTNYIVANNVLELITSLPNVKMEVPYYNWSLLSDKDDNKFVDLFVSSSSDYLVSNDKVFKELKIIEFPEVKHITIHEFI